MNLRSKDADEEIEIDMSPMIDMVFLLLIFFIVASKIINDRPPVTVPYAKAVTLPKDQLKDNKIVRYTISISKDKDNEKHYYLPGSSDTMVTFDQLKEGIKQALDKAKSEEKDLHVVIRGDGDVEFADTEKVMKECAYNGAFNMIFAAMEEGL